MKRILFVDDEPAVLDALRDSLRKQCREWEMVFAIGGQAALDECARGAFDVVVSDMRMPGMDGAALLRRIKDAYPKTVRIVLSGQAEREAVMRALPVAHQYMSKPCDSEPLRRIIERACALQTLMSDDTLRSIVGRVEKLPSVSTIYMELAEVLARPVPSIDDVVKVVERDPAMCLKLLQIVNSAFFGLPRRVTAMRGAIGYLGIDLVKSLAVAAQIFAAAEGPEGLEDGWLSVIQRHSMLVARVARKIAPSEGDDAFMAGMLHDVGKIVLAMAYGSEFALVEALARDRGVSSYVVERERFLVTHADVGAYILGTWGLPFGIVAAVAGHHEPRGLNTSFFDATTAVHVADGLVTESGGNGPIQGAFLDQEYLNDLGVLRDMPAWAEVVKELRQEARD